MKLVLLEFGDTFVDISRKRSPVSISEPLFMKCIYILFIFLLFVTIFFYYLRIINIIEGNVRLRLFTLNVTLRLEAERERI
jgi:hypothetical protein